MFIVYTKSNVYTIKQNMSNEENAEKKVPQLRLVLTDEIIEAVAVSSTYSVLVLSLEANIDKIEARI